MATPTTSNCSSKNNPSEPPPLITVRAALVAVLGILCGVVVGVLTYLAGANVPASILAGLLAIGGATTFFHRVIS